MFSIVICAYNEAHNLDDVLEGCAALDPTVEHEIIVVDDGSTDETAHVLGPWQERGVRVVALRENGGLSNARNRGADEARFSQILYLDADAVPRSDLLVAYAGRVDDRTITGGASFLFDDHDVVDFGPRRSLFHGGSRSIADPARADVVVGCNMVVPRTVLDAIGGFDPLIQHYFDERDLTLRAQDAGFAVRYVPEAVVFHKNSAVKHGSRLRKAITCTTYSFVKRHRGRPWALAAKLPAVLVIRLGQAAGALFRHPADAPVYVRGFFAGLRFDPNELRSSS